MVHQGPAVDRMKEAAMPELKQLRVVVGSFGKSGILKGDHVVISGAKEGVVESIETKATYQYYLFTNGLKGRLPIDHEVNVDRMVPTPEEEAAEQLTRFAKDMRRKHDASIKSVDDGVDLLTSQYKAARTKGNYQAFSLDKAATIAKDQERMGVWMSVAENVAKHTELKPDVRWLRAVCVMRQYAREALTNRYRNSLSRSTSVISNLQEDMRMDAWADFLHDTEYWPFNEMVAVYLPGLEIKEV